MWELVARERIRDTLARYRGNHIGLDHVGRYRDTFVPDGDTWLIKHRKVSTDWAASNSAMARQPSDS
jgi:hypothetical protein